MSYDKLIERLRHFGGELGATPLNNVIGQYMLDAADVLSMLQVENEKLQAELEQVKAERDAAVKDLNEFLSMDELCPIQCEWCKWNGTYCDGKTPEWRGIKED